MGLRLYIWGLVFFLGFPGHLALAESICPGDVGVAISEVIQRPEWRRSRWGVLVETLEDGRVLYALDEDKYFVPASNVKLFTAAAALVTLGPEFRIRTSVYGVGKPPRLRSLRVVGKGDPSLTSKQLRLLAQQLQEKGVREISQLIVDDSYFKDLPINPSWEWSDLLFYYGPSVNSLILNENAVILQLVPQDLDEPAQLQWLDPLAARQWQIDNQSITAPEGTQKTLDYNRDFAQPVIEITGQLALNSQGERIAFAVADPANYFLDSFRQILLEEGIKVNRATVVKESSDSVLGEELAFVESPDLRVLINKINQESNNLFAEAVVKILGATSGNQTGPEVIKQTIINLGVEGDSFILVDGAGLSRQNLVTPEAVVQILRLMAQSPEAEIYRNSLAVAGVRGTLQNRFKNTPVVGYVQAKTGTLTGVSALSGYLELPNYPPLVFSIMVNYSPLPGTNLRQTIDEIVLLISRLNTCQEPSGF